MAAQLFNGGDYPEQQQHDADVLEGCGLVVSERTFVHFYFFDLQ
jgi:hypothetical protein